LLAGSRYGVGGLEARIETRCWAGVDLGGRSKGFHVAVIDKHHVYPVKREPDAASVVALHESFRPSVIGVDSPITAAPDGKKSREGERKLAAAGVCGIRFTSNKAIMEGRHRTDYYGWIRQGLALYAMLDECAPRLDWKVIEVFPTASWSRWAGRRPKGKTRAAWSREALAAWELQGVPAISNQDVRDAIGAALTARLYPKGTERFVEIVVPKQSMTPSPR
jgi:predicted nuclease with RNAse H fold